MLARLPHQYIINGDEVSPYLVFMNSHDGSSSIKCAVTPIRVVCNNTLNLALRTAKRTWSCMHTGDISDKMLEAREKKLKHEVTDSNILDGIGEMTSRVPTAKKSKSGIVVRGIHDVAVRFSRCCSPVPGDEIVGFVTRGRGVSLHRTDCINIINLPESERVRLIDAEWQQPEGEENKERYSTEIQIYANNRIGMFVDISKVFTERQIDITSMNVRTSKQGKATIIMTFDIHGKEELTKVTDKLRQIEGVLDIERTAG